MKKLIYGKKIRIASDFLLTAIIAVVFAVGLSAQGFVPIYSDAVEAVYRGNVEKKNVSIMFNVYENADVVSRIVDTLDFYNVKATFFVGGCWADDNETTLNKIVSSGHEIANHGYFHKDHAALDYEKNREEIYLTGVIVNALCGAEMKLFAPPSGSYSDATLQSAYDLGYKVVMWSKDTIDWRDSDRAKIVSRATKNLTGGDLILMHPKAHTLAALPEIIGYCEERNFHIVTVGENISPLNTQNT